MTRKPTPLTALCRLFFAASLVISGVLTLSVAGMAQGAGAPSVGYLPILPYGAADDSPPELLPVLSNYPLAPTHPGIKKAVIAIHDRARDASALFNLMTALAGAANQDTFIAAPEFMLESDLARLGDQLPDHGRIFARWPMEGAAGAWEDGGDSVALPPQKGISSYTAIDLLLLYLADRQTFPDLEQIVIAGQGSGGDFVQRYAAIGQAIGLLERQHLAVRFVVANPSSYLYFTASRPRGGRQGFGTIDAAQCPDYNDYPYGLDALNPYARRVGGAAIKLGYVARDVVYLLGENVATDDPVPNRDCAALLQGANRLTRAMNYYLYLTITYSDNAQKTQTFITVPKAAYDAAPLFASKCGVSSLFGDGVCGDESRK